MFTVISMPPMSKNVSFMHMDKEIIYAL
jgi:hypothetical protein